MNPHVMNSHGMSSHVVSSQLFPFCMGVHFPFVSYYIIIIHNMGYDTQKEFLIMIQRHLAKSGGARVSIIQ